MTPNTVLKRFSSPPQAVLKAAVSSSCNLPPLFCCANPPSPASPIPVWSGNRASSTPSGHFPSVRHSDEYSIASSSVEGGTTTTIPGVPHKSPPCNLLFLAVSIIAFSFLRSGPDI